MPQELTIIHFNDVYNIEPQKDEPVGGAARFAAYVKSQQSHNPLILFSGDVLNPSLMSIFMKGEQMVPVMNAIGVHCAVFGNHDFDFGVDHLEDVVGDTKFPWLLSNVVDNLTGEMLGNGKVSYMVEWSGYKIGLMGLVEEEWIETLATLDPEDVTFQDYVVKGSEIAKQLRDEGADIVIALTHMRWPNDRRLAKEVEGIDLILGGHDHDYGLEKVNDRYIVKSGTDFQNLSKVKVCMSSTGVDVNIERVDITSDFPEDPEVLDVVKHLQKDIDSKMEEHLGDMQVELDGRFSAVRTGETNLGNFITDIMLEVTNAEVALLNSGTLRSNRIHPKGEFKLRDLLTILPLVDELLVIQCTGEQIVEALENGVSQYPNFDGRFPQVAGIEFGFDPSMPKGKRVEPGLVKIQDHFVDLKRNYRLCTKEYIAQGKDGYEVFKKCPVVMDAEKCCTLSTAVRNHFESVKIYQGLKKCKSGHRQSLVGLVRRRILVRHFISKLRKESVLKSINIKSPSNYKLQRQSSIQDMEEEQSHLCPCLEGRIYIFDDQKRLSLLSTKLSHAHELGPDPEEEDEDEEFLMETENLSLSEKKA